MDAGNGHAQPVAEDEGDEDKKEKKKKKKDKKKKKSEDAEEGNCLFYVLKLFLRVLRGCPFHLLII